MSDHLFLLSLGRLVIVLGLFPCLGAVSAPADELEEVDAGEGLTATIEACAACHGARGEGDRSKFSPSLAGLPAWYINRSMQMYLDGRREPLPEGPHGGEMVALLKATDWSELEKAAAHYSRLDPIPLESEGGDPVEGRLLYRGRGACINCHLENGNGSRSSGAPPITIIPDWYFMRQMKAFRSGERVVFGKGHGHGTYREHAQGHGHTEVEILRCMIRAASRLDDTEVRDVAAYVETLAKR